MSVIGTASYGSLDDLDYLLETQEMTEQELRAALQNVLRHVAGQDARIKRLEEIARTR